MHFSPPPPPRYCAPPGMRDLFCERSFDAVRGFFFRVRLFVLAFFMVETGTPLHVLSRSPFQKARSPSFFLTIMRRFFFRKSSSIESILLAVVWSRRAGQSAEEVSPISSICSHCESPKKLFLIFKTFFLLRLKDSGPLPPSPWLPFVHEPCTFGVPPLVGSRFDDWQSPPPFWLRKPVFYFPMPFWKTLF